MRYFFIINCRKDKAAIREEVKTQLEELRNEIEQRGDSITTYLTTGEGDATREVRLYSDLHPNEEVCFVACGGDGTVNEVASGIVGFKKKSMAILVFHSNCDFIKYYPGRCFTSVREIIDGEDIQIDIIKINDSYAINYCGIGFDAVVASTANSLAAEGKKNVFRKGIIRGILTGRFTKARIIADGEKIGRRRLLLCTLANGRYCGGEFLVAPRAQNNDGLIDLCFIRPILLLTFALIIPIYKRGEHLDHKHYSKKFIYRQTKNIVVTAKNTIELCLDGEILPGTRFNIEILPNEITLRLPSLQNE